VIRGRGRASRNWSNRATARPRHRARLPRDPARLCEGGEKAAFYGEHGHGSLGVGGASSLAGVRLHSGAGPGPASRAGRSERRGHVRDPPGPGRPPARRRLGYSPGCSSLGRWCMLGPLVGPARNSSRPSLRLQSDREGEPPLRLPSLRRRRSGAAPGLVAIVIWAHVDLRRGDAAPDSAGRREPGIEGIGGPQPVGRIL
jgi:hypothetical protein